jgi:hypothetical protein
VSIDRLTAELRNEWSRPESSADDQNSQESKRVALPEERVLEWFSNILKTSRDGMRI